MGTWASVVRENDLEEASPGDGVESTERYPEPGEGYCYVAKRTDAAGDGDPWQCELQVSVDVAADEWVSVDFRRQASTDTLMIFPVRGPIPACRIRGFNDDPTPTDTLKMDVDFQRDAVTI